LVLNNSNELVVGGALQVGDSTSASYSRFGATGTSYASTISTSDDLLISGDLEIDGQVWLDANASVSGDLEVGGTISGDGSGLSGVHGDPAGSDGQIQYNNGGVMGGTAQLYWDDANNYVGIGDSTPEVEFEVVGAASISGNLDTWGTFTANTAASHSFAGDLDIGDDLVITGDLSWGTMSTTVDISDNTNLAVTGPLRLAGDTLDIDYASASGDGYLTSSDWTNFNSAYDWKTTSESFYDTAYTERGSQIAGNQLTWNGTQLDVDDPFTVTHLNFTTASGSGNLDLSGIFTADSSASHSFAGDLAIGDDVTVADALTVSGITDLANVSSFTLTGTETLGATYWHSPRSYLSFECSWRYLSPRNHSLRNNFHLF